MPRDHSCWGTIAKPVVRPYRRAGLWRVGQFSRRRSWNPYCRKETALSGLPGWRSSPSPAVDGRRSRASGPALLLWRPRSDPLDPDAQAAILGLQRRFRVSMEPPACASLPLPPNLGSYRLSVSDAWRVTAALPKCSQETTTARSGDLLVRVARAARVGWVEPNSRAKCGYQAAVSVL